MGWFEILLVGVLALLLFGADELPHLARSLARVLGRGHRLLHVIKREWYDLVDEVQDKALIYDPLRHVPKNKAKSIPTSKAHLKAREHKTKKRNRHEK